MYNKLFFSALQILFNDGYIAYKHIHTLKEIRVNLCVGDNKTAKTTL